MSAVERKALFLRNVPSALVREAKAAAARRGETLTTIVAEALARSLAVADDQGEPDGLQGDVGWYRRNLPDLLRRYRGEHVAVVDAAVVDHDHDFGALAARVFKRFGNRSVYMPRVQTDEPVARIRSPRRSRP